MNLTPELQQALKDSPKNFFNPIFGLVSSDFKTGANLGCMGPQLDGNLERTLLKILADFRSVQQGKQPASKPAGQ